MNNTIEYRHFADECFRLAQQTHDAASKKGYLALERYWRHLSEKFTPQPNEN
jgi:hypothetical protein